MARVSGSTQFKRATYTLGGGSTIVGAVGITVGSVGITVGAVGRIIGAVGRTIGAVGRTVGAGTYVVSPGLRLLLLPVHRGVGLVHDLSQVVQVNRSPRRRAERLGLPHCPRHGHDGDLSFCFLSFVVFRYRLFCGV